jgi:poly(A) polymerase
MAGGADAPKQYGITKPLSLLGPVEADLQRTGELEKFLVEAGLYESAEESARREEVLGKLDQVISPGATVVACGLCIGEKGNMF